MSFTMLAQSAHQAQFLRNMALIDALRGLAVGEPAVADLASDLNLSSEASTYLLKTDGRALIGRWAFAFKASLTALDEFREAEVRGGLRRSPSESDVKKVALASQEVLDALADRLEQRATV